MNKENIMKHLAPLVSLALLICCGCATHSGIRLRTDVTPDEHIAPLPIPVDVTYDRATLGEVLTDAGEVCSLNIVSSGDFLDLEVSAQLRNVDVRQALELMLMPHDLLLCESPPGSENYRVWRPKPAGPPHTKVAEIAFTYLDVEEVISLLRTSFLDAQWESVAPIPSRHAVAVRSTPEVIADIQEFIEKIDKPNKALDGTSQ